MTEFITVFYPFLIFLVLSSLFIILGITAARPPESAEKKPAPARTNRKTTLPQAAIDTRPTPPTTDGTVTKIYKWRFPQRQENHPRLPVLYFSLNLPINQSHYQTYRQRPRERNAMRFHTYVTLSTPEVKTLARQLQRQAKRLKYLAYEQLCYTVSFVQQTIQYVQDLSETGEIIEYPKYPVETLMEQTGDCEDQVILAAALLKRMGYEVALLILPTHVALGISGFSNLKGAHVTDPASGICYYYTETTAHSWLPGEVPPKFQAEFEKGPVEILPVV